MTLYEAVGIDKSGIDVETGKELSHEETYGRMVELVGGVDAVRPYIPFTDEELAKAYASDPSFNTLPIEIWNYAAGFTQHVEPGTRRQLTTIHPGCGVLHLTEAHGIDVISLAEAVCLLKQAARMSVRNMAGKEDGTHA